MSSSVRDLWTPTQLELVIGGGLELGVVLDAEVLCALVAWLAAAVEDAALATAVRPAEAVGDRHLVALVACALGATAVAPAETLGLGAPLTAVQAALGRAA